jgi:two-component system, NtrC family, response regulator HydG
MDPKSSKYLNKAINVLNEAVFVYDENMRIKYFNSAAEQITGHRKEDVIGKKCVSLFDQSVCLNNCALCQTVKNDPSQGTVRFQSAFIRKDGVKRSGEFKAGLLKRDKNGAVEVLVALTDTTEMTHMKEKLSFSFRNIVGKNHLMQELFRTIRNIAEFDTTVLIQGESGTGKELVAKAIHFESPRADGKLVTVNCSAFSEDLLESELFGHAKGAFTGAFKDRTGRFEEANGGTIFLDEVGDLSARVQVKLLRVIQEKEVQRVGENITRKVNIRILAATHKDLQKEVRERRFREDLYYRLHVVPVQLTPLRLRKDDIAPLARHFIKNWTQANKKTIDKISNTALGRLMDYDWPGNVRELENAIEHASVKCSQKIIEEQDLPIYISQSPQKPEKSWTRNRVTRDMVLQALAETGNNQTHAARLLNIHRITLWRKMQAFNIDA